MGEKIRKRADAKGEAQGGQGEGTKFYSGDPGDELYRELKQVFSSRAIYKKIQKDPDWMKATDDASNPKRLVVGARSVFKNMMRITS